jgi:hypothetical protein
MPDVHELARGLAPFGADALDDPDQDFIPNGVEYLLGTDPFVPNHALPDGDGDGMPTRWEAAYGTDWTEPDATDDPDLDGLPNAIEARVGLPPLVATEDLTDSDGDGMPDRYEAVMGRNPMVSNAGADPDGDDKPDLLEMTSGALPDMPNALYADFDGDEMPNYWEQAFAPGLDWTEDDALGNPDFDDIKNVVEWRVGTSPLVQTNDTDNDGLADLWELAWGQGDPDGNPDGDIYLNLVEYTNGTNPLKVDPYAIALSPELPIVEVGEELQFAVGAAVGPLSWAVSDTDVATIAQDSTLTGKALGWVEVTVTDANGQTGSTLAFVYPVGGGSLPLQIAPVANQIVVAGDTVAFLAVGGTPPYSWSVLNGSIATVSASGVYKALGSYTGVVATRVKVTDSTGASVQSGLLTTPFDHEQDGLPDYWEVLVGLNPHVDDTLQDPDADGATNLCEWTKGTHPQVLSDGDPCDGDCCELGVEGGCTDASVEVCVCALDATCCNALWDAACATLAATECGADCCGNDACTADESCETCPADCGPCEGCKLDPLGDVDGNGVIDVVDVQCTVVTSLWQLSGGPLPSCLYKNDPKYANLDCGAKVDVIDVQLTIGVAIGKPLDPVLDANGDGCPDSCEL